MSRAVPGTVIFVDDDAVVRDATVQSLQLAGLRVEEFAEARGVLRRIDRDFAGVLVSDIRMPGIDGLQLFKAVQAIDPTIPVILITGHGDVAMAVAALQDGADDFITKPFASGHLISSVQRGLSRRQLELDNRALRETLERDRAEASPLVGEAPAIVRLRHAIEQAALADLNVLVEGEGGTGKELVAGMVHRAGRRRVRRFVAVNCASLPSSQSDELLFGKGVERGIADTAEHGTLFLDEIDMLDWEAQSRLLRLLEEREVVRAGAIEPHILDLRVIAATRRDLRALVADRRFREDLYFALGVVHLRIPPLRERASDVPMLFASFVDEAAAQLRRSPGRLTDGVRRHLLSHDWPGNVRELRSFAFQFVLGVDEGSAFRLGEEGRATLPERVERFEAVAIRNALEDSKGSAAKAIALLGIPRKTFYDKLHRHRIAIDTFRTT